MNRLISTSALMLVLFSSLTTGTAGESAPMRDPEHRREQLRTYLHDHPEAKERARAWLAEHPEAREKLREKIRERMAQHPERRGGHSKLDS